MSGDGQRDGLRAGASEFVDGVAGTEPDADQSAEIERLRALVGPTEASYEDLQVELANARNAVKAADAELGRLRGEITELRLDLHRAQQDQYHIRRLILRPAIAVRNRLRRDR
jgi:chromosome segregation ATPase